MVRQYLAALFHGWIGKMSGPASVALAILPLVFPKLFAEHAMLVRATWVAAVVCFAVANYSAWRYERGRYESERAKGEAAPHMDINVVSVIPRGEANQILTDLFFNVYLILADPSEATVQNFSLELFNTAQSLTLPATEDISEWELVLPVGSYTRSVCNALTKHLTQRGDPTQGWVHFQLPQLKESAVTRCILRLKINCAHGTCYTNVPGTDAYPDANAKGIMMRKTRRA